MIQTGYASITYQAIDASDLDNIVENVDWITYDSGTNLISITPPAYKYDTNLTVSLRASIRYLSDEYRISIDTVDQFMHLEIKAAE